VERTLLSVAFDLDLAPDLDVALDLDLAFDLAFDLGVDLDPIPTRAARSTVEERRFSAA